MAQEIHARKTKEGMRFRIWSTISDSYLTNEMTEEEVREYTLVDAVAEAIKQHLRGIDDRIQRTRERGTSSRLGDTRELDAPWDKERRE